MQTLSSKSPEQRRRERLAAERREIYGGGGNAFALSVVAGSYPWLPEQLCEQWVKVIRYQQTGGGKVIVFKTGNPHLRKEGQRKECSAVPEDEREAVRLSQSLSRTRRRVFEIAACNPWEWFFTGTLDAQKCDRNDLNGTFRRLSQWMRDFRKSQPGEKLSYLIVPEMHKNGGWHFHGLLNGVSENELHKFETSEKIPLRIKRTIQNGTDVFSWTGYSDKFGYSAMTRVRDENAVACYVTKYITKDMVLDNHSRGKGEHLYYASRGLRKPETVAESYPETAWVPQTDYENDYVAIKTFSTDEEMNAIIDLYGIRRETE